jgi:hypothetical protein
MEIADEQNEENAKRMQLPDQAHALAGRFRPHPASSVPDQNRPAENTERRE